MESSYHIDNTCNRFALLMNDESDLFELVKKQEKGTKMKKNVKISGKENKEKTENQNKLKPITEEKKIKVVDSTNVSETKNVEKCKPLTIDQWKAQLADRIKPTFNVRKAGEGEDQCRWDNMHKLQKKNISEEPIPKDKEVDVSEHPRRVRRQKQTVEINITFNDGRGWGARVRGKGPRAGRGRHPNRDTPQRFFENDTQVISTEGVPQHNKKAPKMDDEHDFPYLVRGHSCS